MKLTLKDQSGNQAGELDVNFTLIEGQKGTQAVHDVVVAYLAAQRSGTACTKTRGEVAGSGKKPWRQKGTGRARAGSRRSPIWRGGGVVFGPRPRDYSKKTPKRVRRLALRKSFSERLKAGDVLVVDQLKLVAPKTKEFIKIFDDLGLNGTALFVVDEAADSLLLAARNLRYVDIISDQELNTYQILKYDHLVFTQAAYKRFEERVNTETK